MKKQNKQAPPSINEENPFARMFRNQQRIINAIHNRIPVSSLKDIRFVKPIKIDEKLSLGQGKAFAYKMIDEWSNAFERD